MVAVAQFVEGDPRPFIEQVAQFVEFPYHAIQENPLKNDITRGFMALFLTLVLYQQLHQFKIESVKALILHIIAFLFAAQTGELGASLLIPNARNTRTCVVGFL